MADANTLDFFGGGSSSGSLANPGGVAPFDVDPASLVGRTTPDFYAPSGFIGKTDVSGGATGDPLAALRASQSGNIGGATGEYNSVSDAGRGALDYYHNLNSGTGLSSLFNRMGEDVGVSHVGDAVGNPLDTLRVASPGTLPTDAAKGALNRVIDPNTGLGTTLVDTPGGSSAGRPISNMTPETAAAAKTFQDTSTSDMLKSSLAGALNGIGGPAQTTFDTSGADRGSSKIPGIDDATAINNVNGTASQISARGGDVLSGQLAPGGQGAQGQQDALDRLLAFNPTAQQSQLAATQAYNPTAQSGVMSKLDAFSAQPQGPSAAQLQLQQGNQAAMADALSVARSGTARDAGSQARALNAAVAQNASTNVDAARNAATLKASEDQAFKAQQLQALQQQGTLASGVDQSKLTALGQGNALAAGLDQSKLTALGQSSDVANQIRSANTAERGQSLGYDSTAQQTGATLTGDALKSIPAIEAVNHSDQFGLTPDQQLAAAQMGHTPPTTLDTILGLGKDILPLL